MTNGSPEPPARDQIRAALERVLSSPQFSASSRLSRFLRFAVTETLEGRGATLKEYVIGVSVYDRGEDFEPKSDSIVRVDAVKLRARLAEYYAGAGASDEVHISIPKGGYVAAFTAVEPHPEIGRPYQAAVQPNSFQIGRLAAATLVAAIAFLASVFWLSGRQANSRQAPTLIPFTTYPGHEYRPSLSPDGRYAAFGWANPEHGGNFDIWLRPVSEDKPVRLTTNPAWEGAPEWSPNGEWIAFARSPPNVLMILDPVRRGERNLGPRGPNPNPCFGWLPDSRRVLFAGANGALWSVDINGGAPAEFARPPQSGLRINCGKTSPDGQWLAVMTDSDLFVRRLTGGPWTAVTTEHLPIRSFTWMSDSESMLFTGARQGDWTLWQVSRQGGVPERVPGPSEGAWYVSATKDLAVFTQAHHDSNLVDIDLGSMRKKRIFVSTRREAAPRLSADGAQVAFASDRDGNRDLWVGNRDGSGLRRLTDFGGAWVQAPAWSPDGAEIAFHVSVDGSNDIYSVPAGGGRVRRLTDSTSSETSPEWSPDGKTIYFCSDRSGRDEIWKQPAAGGAARQVTSGGGREPKLDPTGQWLYFLRNDGTQKFSASDRAELFRVPAQGGVAVPIVPEVGMGRWSVTARGVLFVESLKAGAPVQPGAFLVPFAGGRPSRLGTLPVPNMVLAVSASVAGDRIIISLLESAEADLMLLRGIH